TLALMAGSPSSGSATHSSQPRMKADCEDCIGENSGSSLRPLFARSAGRAQTHYGVVAEIIPAAMLRGFHGVAKNASLPCVVASMPPCDRALPPRTRLWVAQGIVAGARSSSRAGG